MIECEGFTRPECQPCPNEAEEEPVLVDTVEGEQEKHLCSICKARLLPPVEQGGWQ